jgi:hypothetical protein
MAGGLGHNQVGVGAGVEFSRVAPKTLRKPAKFEAFLVHVKFSPSYTYANG